MNGGCSISVGSRWTTETIVRVVLKLTTRGMLWINGKAAVPKLAHLSHASYSRRWKPGPHSFLCWKAPQTLTVLRLPRCTCSCTIPYITPLLLQNYYSEVKIAGSRALVSGLMSHPIQHTQELHQDESCIF